MPKPTPTSTSRTSRQVPSELKAKIEDKIKAVKDAVASDDTAQIKAASEDLQKEVMNLGAAVYGQQGGAGAGAGGPPPGGEPGAGPAGGAGPGKGPVTPDDVIDV
jgi:hypothetical protein